MNSSGTVKSDIRAELSEVDQNAFGKLANALGSAGKIEEKVALEVLREALLDYMMAHVSTQKMINFGLQKSKITLLAKLHHIYKVILL